MEEVLGQVVIRFDPVPGPKGDKGDKGDSGPAGGILKQHVTALHAPGGTCSSTGYSAITGHTLTITPSGTRSKIIVEAEGVVGHTDAGSIVHFAILRNGALVTLPAGISGLTCARCVDSSYTHPWRLTFVDEPATMEPVTYQLAARVHGGTAHIGKRAADTVMNVQTRMQAIEL